MEGSVPVGRATADTETTESLTMAGTSMPPATLRSTAAPSTSLGEALSIVGLSWSSLSLPSAAMLTTPWFFA